MFRDQVYKAQQSRLSGKVILTLPRGYRRTIWSITCLLLTVLVLVVVTDYQRTHRVIGYLVPDKGMIQGRAERSGILLDVRVKPGDKVEQGQAIALIASVTKDRLGRGQDELQLSILTQQLALLEQDSVQLEQQKREQSIRLERQVEHFKQQANQLDHQLTLAMQNKHIAKEQYEVSKHLHRTGMTTANMTQQSEVVLIGARSELLELEQRLQQIAFEVQQSQFQLEQLDITFARQQSDIAFKQKTLSLQIEQTQSNGYSQIVAPESGVIGSVHVHQGDSIVASQLLYQLQPTDSSLVAQLIVPTRAAGFVTEQSIAKLRFDAFPYQKYGMLEAQISHIEQAVLLPNDSQLPVPVREPAYRMTATWSEAQREKFSAAEWLQPGLVLNADVVFDRQPLWQWLLTPVLKVIRN